MRKAQSERSLMVKRGLKRGDVVTTRAFREKQLQRRVWKQGKTVVFLCTEERYHQAKLLDEDPDTVGFPNEDILTVHPEGSVAEEDPSCVLPAPL